MILQPGIREHVYNVYLIMRLRHPRAAMQDLAKIRCIVKYNCTTGIKGCLSRMFWVSMHTPVFMSKLSAARGGTQEAQAAMASQSVRNRLPRSTCSKCRVAKPRSNNLVRPQICGLQPRVENHEHTASVRRNSHMKGLSCHENVPALYLQRMRTSSSTVTRWRLKYLSTSIYQSTHKYGTSTIKNDCCS